MAIYGSSYPQFRSIDANPNAVITLQNSIIKENWSRPQLVRNTSVLNKKDTWTILSTDHAQFIVTVFIWKYTDPATKMNTLMAYNHDRVNFMPHSDSGTYVKQDATTNAILYITKMEPFYMKTEPPVLYDMLRITFESLTPVHKQFSAPT